MVAIFTGLGAGLARGSANLLGGSGQLGSASLGRGGDNVAVNAATGNLVISREDEFLVGRGPDLAISRTYNSLAQTSDRDNGDQWQMGTTRWVVDVPDAADLNIAGSTVKRQGADGSLIAYVYETRGGVAAYWSTDADGAHDKLVKSGATWVWTDGSSQVTETYAASAGDANKFRITEQKDTDGYKLTFTYNTGTDKLQRVTTYNNGVANATTGIAEQSYVEYFWSGNNIERIITGYTDYGDLATEADNVNRTLTRTRYEYYTDGTNRLKTVTVDLSPDDNSVTDLRTYVTSYTYDGASDRVASITQTGGSSLAITYDTSGRVKTLTETVAPGDTRLTTLTYGVGYTTITGPDLQVTRLDYDSGNIVPSSVMDWSAGGVTREAAEAIDGEAAVKLTSAASATYSYVGRTIGAVAADTTLRFTVSLQALAGSATSQWLGLHGTTSGWGSGGVSARILSGPGTLTTSTTGLWQVTGLSDAEATRIEITRTYSQAETATAYVYVDYPAFNDGQQLLVAGAMVTTESDNLATGAPGTWNLSGVGAEPADGTAATLLTSSAGAGSSTTYTSIGTVAANTAVTFTVSLQAVAGWAAEQSFGLYGVTSGWGSGGVSAQIVSGPGTLVTSTSGLWRVTGLSTSQATRIQITRTYAQSEEARAYVYVDHPGGYRDGQQLIVSNASVTAGGANLVSPTVGSWTYAGMTRAPGGTVGGAEATMMAVATAGQAGYLVDSLGRVAAGTTVRFAVNLQAVASSATEQSLGLYGITSGWGSGGVSARIVSGPGTLVTSTNGLWRVTGLSTTQATRIEITRTYTQGEEARAHVYVDHPGGYRAGQQLLMSGAELTTDSPNVATNRLTKITAPAVSGVSQTVQFAYDREGNLTSVTDGAGKISGYTYDAMGNVLTATDANGSTVTRTYGAKNELLTEARTGSDASGAAVLHTTRYVYDTENHLRYVVSALGRVTEYRYTGSGQRSYVIEYPEQTYPTASGVFDEAALNAWRDGITDRSSTKIHTFTYDSRDNLYYDVNYGYATAAGTVATTEGYSRTYLAYDQAGRLLSRYNQGENAETFVYDGLGRLVAAADLSGGVTTYRFEDETTTTIVHLATGLTQTRVYNKAGDLVSETSTTPGYQPDAVLSDISTWGSARVTRTAATAIGGEDAYTYTMDATGAYGYVTASMAVGAGETATWRITVKGNPADTHRLGLYGTTELWGTISGTDASAVVIKGPGEVRPAGTYGGLFDLTGLSETQETVIELRRTYAEAQSAGAYFYIGGTGTNVPAGMAVTLAATNLTRTITDANEDISAASGNLYDKNGRLRVATDATGYKSYTVYDKAGRKVADVNHYGHITEYRYDAAGRVAATVIYTNALEAGDLTTLGNANAVFEMADIRPAAHSYDIWQWSVYDAGGRLIESIDGDGGVTAYSYDASDRLVKTVSYANKLSAAQVTGFKTTPPTASILPTADAAKDAVTRSFYDADGRVIGALDGEGYLSEIVYDDAGQKVEEIAYATKTTSSLWAAGTFTDLRTSAVPASAANRSTHYVYDGQGVLRYTIDDAGRASSHAYNVAGKLTTTVAYATAISTTDFTYDNVKALVAAIASDTADRKSFNIYNAKGQVAYTIGALGQVSGYTYDNAGRVVKTVQYAPTGGVALYALTTMDSWAATNAGNAGNRVTRNWYNARGDLRFTVDAEGYIRRYDYDVAGRLTREVTWANVVTATDSTTLAGATTLAGGAGTWTDVRYTYDAAGRRNSVYDGEGNRTVEAWFGNGVGGYTYYAHGTTDQSIDAAVNDGAGRLTLEYHAYTDADQVYVRYGFDGQGNRITVTDPKGNVTTYVYDRRGLVTSVTDAMGGVTTYEYNAFGEVVKTTDAELNSTYSYYDTLGRVTTSRDAESYVSKYTYTEFDEVASVTRHYSKTASAVSTTTLPTVAAHGKDAVTRFTYDKLGRVTQEVDAEGYVETSAYDVFGNLLTFRRYELSVYGSYGGETGSFQEAYAAAILLQQQADTLAAASTTANATRDAALVTKNNAQTTLNNAQSAATASAAAVTSLQQTISSLQSQIAARPENAVILNSLSYLQAYRTAYLAPYYNELAAHNAYAATLPPYDQYGYYMSVILPLETALAQISAPINAAVSSVAAGNPLPVEYYDEVLAQAGYNSTQISSFVALGQSLANAQASLPGAQATAATNASALTAAQTALNQATTAYNQAVTAATAAQTAATNAQADATAALTVAQQLVASTSSSLPAFTLAQLETPATTTFEYDRRGNLKKTTDARGFYESYTYDARGLRKTAVGKSATGSIAAGGTTTYTYDKRGLLISETLPIQSYNSAGTALGAITHSYAYDGRGNLVRKTEAQGLPEERVTDYTYDKLNRLKTTVGEAVSGVAIDASTNTVSTVSGSPTVTNTYDLNGNLTKTVDAAGAATVFFYDDLNRKSVEINALGAYTRYLYDANGNVESIKIYETTVAVPANGGSVDVAPAAPAGAARETSFDYDGLGRMITSTVVLPGGYVTGTWNGTAWSNAATTALTTSYTYDYLGNVVKLTDPNGNATFSYYDMIGRKTAQVDGQGYLTDWAYDSDGNVLSERRYATRFTGTPAIGTPPMVLFHAADRVTNYTYDLNGNRLSEARTGVVVHNGSGGTSTVTATIAYLYNGLGQVTRKTEATGDQFNYTYDVGGRLTQEARPTFASNSGNVSPLASYFYDGLGNLVRNVQAAGGDAAARTTTYSFGAGGRLASMTDAENGVRNYLYDVAGRLVLEHYTRTVTATSGTTSTVVEGVGYRYDALGRSLGQGFYKNVSSAWQFQSGNSYSTLEYNAFGDVVRTGANGLWQQENKYDLAGRVWATNSGDGVWKYFGYDKNGNQTVAITSAGAALTGKTFAQALAMIGQADVNGSYTVYDKRNLATSAVEEGRELTAGGNTTLTTSRTYNAFGETATETNAAGATITYTYNTMGRMTRSESPTVSMTLEDGTSRWVKPSQDYYYDASGRLVATRDANGTYATGGTSTAGKSKAANTGNLTRLTLLAGTGYGGSEALVTHETHADTGVRQTSYDIHGNARVVIDEENRTLATQTYDDLGRLITAVRLGGLTDNYTYDVLGQQVTHWNSLYGSANKEISVFDIEGRITSTRAFGGDVTSMAYTWDATLEAAGTGLTNTGGWSKVTTFANALTLTEKSDLFGRAIHKSDLGGHVTDYTYDLAGRLTKSQIGTTSYNYEYYNTGEVEKAFTTAPNWTYYTSTATAAVSNTFASTTTQSATYTYDEVGNRLTEYGTLVNGSTTVVWKNHTATYDDLGRLLTDTMAATTVQPAAGVVFQYDANGNVRSKTSTFRYLDASGGVGTSSYTKAAWYRYDSMNRVVINNGVLGAGQIVLGMPVSIDFVGDPSQSISYNKAGQRTTATTNQYFEEYIPTQQTPWGTLQGFTAVYAAPTREDYVYDAAGRLDEIRVTDSALDVASWIANAPSNPPLEAYVVVSSTAYRRSDFTYDAMGRETAQTGYGDNGTTAVYSSTTTYNAKGQVSNTYASTLKVGGTTQTQSTTNSFTTAGGQYLLGAVASSTTTGTTASTTTNSYEWWDSAVQSGINYVSGSNNWTTTFTFNGLGQMTRAQINDGKPRTVTFSLDEIGQIIRRDETNVSGQTGAPHELWYRLGDREIGYIGNNSGEDPTLLGSLEQVQAVNGTGTFRGGATTARSNIGFAQALEPINLHEQGSQAGGYTVQAGDTLQGIAKRLYGDASLWYKIAEINGLSAGSSLIQGQQLTLPGGVIRNTYTNDSFRPYDPAQAIGDLSPTTPKPAKNNKCGVFGQILSMVVAVAASYLLGPIAGNLVSQGFNNLIGLQDGFSWKSLGMSVLSAAVTAGVGSALGNGAMLGSQFVGDVVRGAASSAITQGIGVATRMQDKFSWAGVAAAGIGAGIGGVVTRALSVGKGFYADGKTSVPDGNGGTYTPSEGSWVWNTGQGPSIGTQAVAAAASTIASAATRSAITGQSFGDSMMAAIPDVIGQVVGGALGRAMGGSVWGDKDHDGILGVLQDISDAPTTVGRTVGAKIGDLVESAAKDVASLIQHGATVGSRGRMEARARLAYALTFNAEESMARYAANFPGGAEAVQVSQVRDSSGRYLLPDGTLLPSQDLNSSQREALFGFATLDEVAPYLRALNPKIANDLVTLYSELISTHNYSADRSATLSLLAASHGLNGAGIDIAVLSEARVMPEELLSISKVGVVNGVNYNGVSRSDADFHAPYLSLAMARDGIVTYNQRVAFLANVIHETDELRTLVEYGGRSYFNRYEPGTNAGRNVGNTQAGDGYLYRGRGYLQVTGRWNYTNRGFANNPDALAIPLIGAFESSKWWTSRGLDQTTINSLSAAQFRRVVITLNGGTNGLAHRQAIYDRAIRLTP